MGELAIHGNRRLRRRPPVQLGRPLEDHQAFRPPAGPEQSRAAAVTGILGVGELGVPQPTEGVQAGHALSRGRQGGLGRQRLGGLGLGLAVPPGPGLRGGLRLGAFLPLLVGPLPQVIRGVPHHRPALPARAPFSHQLLRLLLREAAEGKQGVPGHLQEALLQIPALPLPLRIREVPQGDLGPAQPEQAHEQQGDRHPLPLRHVLRPSLAVPMGDPRHMHRHHTVLYQLYDRIRVGSVGLPEDLHPSSSVRESIPPTIRGHCVRCLELDTRLGGPHLGGPGLTVARTADVGGDIEEIPGGQHREGPLQLLQSFPEQ
mmetsp:Transcript_91472/g.244936  ORF Transcript_91472/g.244936 Transcript_91472/m.244936 type:complete len:316 (+) Transcript_91472:803-1750(+)